MGTSHPYPSRVTESSSDSESDDDYDFQLMLELKERKTEIESIRKELEEVKESIKLLLEKSPNDK